MKYQSPEITVIELKAQAVLCVSSGTEDYGGPSTPDWFD